MNNTKQLQFIRPMLARILSYFSCC